MKIALGTTSEIKRQFLSEVLSELEISADICSIDVFSGVSDQPLDSEETMLGSINRARKAIEQEENAEFALGIEVGYHPNSDGDYEMFCWTTLIDRKGKQISAQSHRLLLPSFHQEILKSKKYLGEYVCEYLVKYSDPASQDIGIIIRDRKPFIETSIRSVLQNYLGK